MATWFPQKMHATRIRPIKTYPYEKKFVSLLRILFFGSIEII